MRNWSNKSIKLLGIRECFSNILIVDQELKNTLGHHYEYDRSILKSAQGAGLKCMILGSANVESKIKDELKVIPVFSQSMWVPNGGSQFICLKLNLIYFIDLVKSFLFRGIFFKRRKLIFVHSVNADQLFGLMLFSIFFMFFYKRLAVVLRYQNEVYLNPLSHLALRIAEKMSKIKLYSDSNILIQDYAWLTLKPIGLIPIPHGAPLFNDNVKIIVRPKKLKVGTLGNPRDEKGIFEIIEAISSINKSENSFEFYIQWASCDELVEERLKKLEEKSFSNVKFVKKLFSAQEYLEYIESLDLVLCPYWASVYSARTSGIFLDCLTHLKPTITTHNTWAGQHYSKSPLEKLLVHEKDSQELHEAIVNFSENYEAMKLASIDLGNKLSQIHTPKCLIEVLQSRLNLEYPFSADSEHLFFIEKPVFEADKEALQASINKFLLQSLKQNPNNQSRAKICSVFPSVVIDPSRTRFALFRFFSFRLKLLRLLGGGDVSSQASNVSVTRLLFAMKAQFGASSKKQVIVNDNLSPNIQKALETEGINVIRL